MPVSYRLSRKIYEALGPEAGSDLLEWIAHIEAACRPDPSRPDERAFRHLEIEVTRLVGELRTDLAKRHSDAMTSLLVYAVVTVVSLGLLLLILHPRP